MEYIVEAEQIKIIVDIIKIYAINIFTYYTAMKLINKDAFKENRFLLLIAIFIFSVIEKIIKEKWEFSASIAFSILFISYIISKRNNQDFVYTLLITAISLSINYVLFLVAIFLDFICNVCVNIKNDYIDLLIIVIPYMIIVYRFLKIKRIKKGIVFLQTKLKNEYLNILILNMSAIIIFTITILSNYNQELARKSMLAFIFFSIMLFITIQKSLQLYYKQKQLIKNLDETKKELEEKKKEIQELEEENLKFSEKSHSISHQQKSLAHKIEKLELKNEIGEESGIKERLNDISKKLEQKEAVKLSETGVTQVDDMLDYMQSECIKNKIDFQLQLNGNIHHMTNKYLEKEELEILLADHIKNAIIAIQYLKETNNKSILVRLGKIDGNYAIYFYDTGIEFNIETLFNLGKKPSTTHKDNGGTGIGFMNTFNTLRKRNASLIVKEYGKPCDSNFTKVLMIIFDGKQEYKICSYRWEEIQKKNVDKDIKIEKI